MRPRAGEGDLIYVGEGWNASVAVTRLASGVLNYHNAGKVQASSEPQDMRLQRMLGHLTTLLPPKADTVLVIGFGLHNATEGFGIVAPLAADEEADRPSWALLGLLGLIGGGPTFVGAVVGHGFTSEAVSVVFLTLAAGSILYVVVQLITVAAKARRPDLLAVGLLLGLLAGFATDAIVTAAGA